MRNEKKNISDKFIKIKKHPGDSGRCPRRGQSVLILWRTAGSRRWARGQRVTLIGWSEAAAVRSGKWHFCHGNKHIISSTTVRALNKKKEKKEKENRPKAAAAILRPQMDDRGVSPEGDASPSAFLNF